METEYPQRVADCIRLKSTPGLPVPEAFEEWDVTDYIQDHTASCEVCELCGHEGLRYHHEIFNRNTRESLLVGSKCIEQFGVTVRDEAGELLSGPAAGKKLRKQRAEMQHESCIQAMVALLDAETNDKGQSIILDALIAFHEDKKLSPNRTKAMLWGLKRLKIPHTASFFKVDLKTSWLKQQVEEMEPYQVHLIWGALSGAQRKRVIKMGKSAPPGLTEPMERAA